MVADSTVRGAYRVRINKDKVTDYTKPLTIRYTRTTNNNYGRVTYINEKTQTIQQWLNAPNQTLLRSKVVVEGYISTFYYNTYRYLYYPTSLRVSVGTLSNVVYDSDGRSKYTLTLTGADAIASRITFDYYYYRGTVSLLELDGSTFVAMYLL